jgi:hypothetical protein
VHFTILKIRAFPKFALRVKFERKANKSIRLNISLFELNFIIKFTINNQKWTKCSFFTRNYTRSVFEFKNCKPKAYLGKHLVWFLIIFNWFDTMWLNLSVFVKNWYFCEFLIVYLINFTECV